MAVLLIEDLVSRTWPTEAVSVEETSTQVEVAFIRHYWRIQAAVAAIRPAHRSAMGTRAGIHEDPTDALCRWVTKEVRWIFKNDEIAGVVRCLRAKLPPPAYW